MSTDRREHGCRAIFAAALVLLLSGRAAWGYVEAPYTLGKLISESSNVLLLSVESVDKQKHTIVYRKVRDVKGNHPGETVKHFIGQNGFHPREWQNIMAWAEVGKTALFFHNRSAGELCIDGYWYQIYAGDWWNMSHAEPYLLRSFAGKPEKLATAVTAILGGQEVVVPCMVDGDKNALQLRNAKMQRMKASLKIEDYNPKRDFVDWGAGADEFRAIAGMPGFTHYLALGALGPGALGVAPGDFAGSGKVGLCLFGAGRLSLLQNGGGAFDDVQLPYRGGARAAAWADYDGDGKLDLLLATPWGPKLFHNDGKRFDDVSAALPDDGYYNLTAAAWIDFDGDGKPDILLADGFRGLRLYRNLGARPELPGQPKVGKWFYAGPFDNPNKKGFEVVHPPERELDLKKEYRGKNNELVVWKEGNFPDGRPNDLRLFKPGYNSNCVAYLYRELDFGGAGELPVVLGSGGTLAVWLNGERIHAETAYHALTADSVPLKLKLRPGKNALLLKICQCDGDFAFCFSMPRLFADVSDQVGLGTGGVGGNLKGDRLAVTDVNGDGRPDFLYSAGAGLLVLNTSQGFVEAKNSGISYQAGGVTPALGDFNGDGRPDLFVPQRGTCKLFRNEGGGRFIDVSAQAGDLAQPIGDARCAAWAEFSKRGRQDLFVGCLKGPNRYFRNNGNGAFSDATEEIGLTYRIFNTCGMAAVDLNNDGAPDVVLSNESQESAVLLGNSGWLAAAEATKAASAAAPQEAVHTAPATGTASNDAAAHAASPTDTAPDDAAAHSASKAARKGSPGVDNESDGRSSSASLARGLSIGIVLIVIALGVGWHVVQSRWGRR